MNDEEWKIEIQEAHGICGAYDKAIVTHSPSGISKECDKHERDHDNVKECMKMIYRELDMANVIDATKRFPLIVNEIECTNCYHIEKYKYDKNATMIECKKCKTFTNAEEYND